MILLKKNRITVELDEKTNEKLNEKSKELKIPKRVILIVALKKLLDEIEQFGVDL